ncbi:peptidylprolyl isomerase [Marinobacter sp. chi1]|uniref:Peptidyl-prolyl cis-trans isomerase n=1 Tax=Marinobacter suaedae TaxID=3057675 RepID=A0ABT8W1C4_9GAMM|nr:peptidylprolyl isomerase [Marinobacter sp. chi1]MDO3722053.1 peptidylprolyl isomerase [Marinobacter sp. chi1]
MLNSVRPVQKLIAALIVLFVAFIPTTAVQAQSDNSSGDEVLPKVRMVTSLGAVVLQLRPDVAPETVENFLTYVTDGFYDSTIFHRVIPGFMIQGGGFTTALSRKQTGAPIVNEASPTLKNLRGTISMARTSAPDSATSQFFINQVDNSFLDAGVRGPGYAVFGKVVEGMEVVDAIADVETGYSRGMADVPVEPVVIENVTVLESEQ